MVGGGWSVVVVVGGMLAKTETSRSSARAGASTTMSIFELFLTRPNERLTVNPGGIQYLDFSTILYLLI